MSLVRCKGHSPMNILTPGRTQENACYTRCVAISEVGSMLLWVRLAKGVCHCIRPKAPTERVADLSHDYADVDVSPYSISVVSLLLQSCGCGVPVGMVTELVCLTGEGPVASSF